MARGRKGGNAKNSLKFAVYGKQGTHKSNVLADFALMKTEDGRPFRVLYIDPENGSIDGFALDRLMELGVNVDNIYIVYTSEYNEIEEYCERAIKNSKFYEIEEVYDEQDEEMKWIEAFGEEDKVILDSDGKPFVADAIVIDGITVIADEINDAAIALSEKRAGIRADSKGKTADEKEVMVGTAGLEFKDYNKIKQRGKKLIYSLLKSTDKHVGISLRAKDEKLMMKTDKGDMQLTATGKEIPESWGFILYDAYTVLHTYNDEEGNTYGIVEDKDRSGQFKPFTELTGDELSVASWQPVIEKNKDRKSNISTKAGSYDSTLKRNEEAYKEISGEKSSTKTVTSEKDLVELCTEAKEMLAPAKKRSLKAKLEKEGLPIKWDESTETEVLEKVLALLKA